MYIWALQPCVTHSIKSRPVLHPQCPRLTCRSLSPTYMLTSSGPLTLMKLAAHWVATALAWWVRGKGMTHLDGVENLRHLGDN